MATEVKWIKIATDIFNNKKIRLIEAMPEGNAIIVVWFKILMLAGTVNDSGNIYLTKDIPYTEQMLATLFNRPLPLVQLALRTFEQFEMIETVNDIIHVSNWEKYQNVDRLNEIREYNRIAKRRQREKQKLLIDVNDMSMTSQPCHDTDIDIDKEIDIDIPPILSNDNISPKTQKPGKKIPPTLEEVQAYCLENNKYIDPEAFWNYYNSNGWRVGKNPMKDWHSAIATWERNDKQYGRTNYKPESKPKYRLSDV